jgi:hypothetical protein
MITLLVVFLSCLFFHKLPNIDCYKITPGFGVSPEGFGVSPEGFGVSPEGFGVSPEGFGVSPEGFLNLFFNRNFVCKFMLELTTHLYP